MLNVGRKDRPKDLVTQDQIPFAFPTDTTKTYTFTPGTGWVVAAGGGAFLGAMHVTYEIPGGTTPATIAAGSYVTRILNTVRSNTISGATLASNIVSLPAGTYEIRGKASVDDGTANNHKCRLYNITSSTAISMGSIEFQTNYPTSSWVFAILTITASTNIALQHLVFQNCRQGSRQSPGVTTDIDVNAELTITKVA